MYFTIRRDFKANSSKKWRIFQILGIDSYFEFCETRFLNWAFWKWDTPTKVPPGLDFTIKRFLGKMTVEHFIIIHYDGWGLNWFCLACPRALCRWPSVSSPFLLPSQVSAGEYGNSVSTHSQTLPVLCNGFCLYVTMGRAWTAPERLLPRHSQGIHSSAAPPACQSHNV